MNKLLIVIAMLGLTSCVSSPYYDAELHKVTKEAAVRYDKDTAFLIDQDRYAEDPVYRMEIDARRQAAGNLHDAQEEIFSAQQLKDAESNKDSE